MPLRLAADILRVSSRFAFFRLPGNSSAFLLLLGISLSAERGGGGFASWVLGPFDVPFAAFPLAMTEFTLIPH